MQWFKKENKKEKNEKNYQYKFTREQFQFASDWWVEKYQTYIDKNFKLTDIEKVRFRKYFFQNMILFILSGPLGGKMIDSDQHCTVVPVLHNHPMLEKSFNDIGSKNAIKIYNDNFAQNHDIYLWLRSDGSIKTEEKRQIKIVYTSFPDDEVIDFDSVELQLKDIQEAKRKSLRS